MKSLLKLFILSSYVAFSLAGSAKVFTECKKPGQFVLTFDDGPKVATTPKALEILKKNGIKATFFINAKNYVDLPNDPEAQKVVKAVFEAGHDIGSHTYEHKDLFQAIAEGSMKLNVDDNNALIKKIIGYTPVFFRPPLGNGGFTKEYCSTHGIQYDPRTEDVRKYLGERGMKIIMWNADTQDWGSEGNVQNAINTLDLSVGPKSPKDSSFITLLHDVHEYTVNVILQEVIDYIKKKGYKFVSLSECIGEAPYREGRNPHQKLGDANLDISAAEPTEPVNATNTTEVATSTVVAAATNPANVTDATADVSNLNSNINQQPQQQQQPSPSNLDDFEIDSSSMKSMIASLTAVIVLSLINALLY